MANQAVVLETGQLQELIVTLKQRSYRVIGPTVRDSAVVYDEIDSCNDLPVGWTDEQNAASYRLQRTEDGQYFHYTVGPQSWKKFLHLPNVRLWKATRHGTDLRIEEDDHVPPLTAFVGVRSCELNAIAVQDRVLLGDLYRDPVYQKQRERILIVAVNCSKAGGTCFCRSMNTGPRARLGFDICLTEIYEAGRHYFVAESGSAVGEEILGSLVSRPAGPDELTAIDRAIAVTERQMGRQLDTTGVKELFYRNIEHPYFEEIASRCLTCGNCTLVCPTCFCTTVEDVTDLTGQQAERWRKWDSCFTVDFTYIHGGSIRSSAYARYRKWITHKLATWQDQFGSSGCVGCGRCITWCPVGIDITEEVQALRDRESVEPAAVSVKE
ncbi:MAG: 4Fe-4S dicluster domain-containing protein [Candidatus Zixiibacteriota bacterium]